MDTIFFSALLEKNNSQGTFSLGRGTKQSRSYCCTSDEATTQRRRRRQHNLSRCARQFFKSYFYILPVCQIEDQNESGLVQSLVSDLGTDRDLCDLIFSFGSVLSPRIDLVPNDQLLLSIFREIKSKLFQWLKAAKVNSDCDPNYF